MGRNRYKNISARKYRLEYCYLLRGALQGQQDRQEQQEVQEPMEQQGQQEQQEVREPMEERVKNNIPKTNSSIHAYYTKYYSY